MPHFGGCKYTINFLNYKQLIDKKLPAPSKIDGDEGLGEVFDVGVFAVEDDGDDVEEEFAVRKMTAGMSLAVEVELGGFHQGVLLAEADVVFRICGHRRHPRLDLDEMKAGGIQSDDIHLGMAAPPVPFENLHPVRLQPGAGQRLPHRSDSLPSLQPLGYHLFVICIDEVHNDLDDGVHLFGLAFRYHQRQGDKCIVSYSFFPVATIENAIVFHKP